MSALSRQTYLLIKLGHPLWQVGVRVKTEIIDCLLDTTQDLGQDDGGILAGVKSMDLIIDSLLNH